MNTVRSLLGTMQLISQEEEIRSQKFRMKRYGKGKQGKILNDRHTAVESIPGVWPQHISSMRCDNVSFQTLWPKLCWEMDVTGQSLRDVIHTVHLQTGLIWEK